MGRSAKPPPPPDYAALTQQQGQINQRMMDRQTRSNRPSQIGPTGSVTWQEDADGNWTQRTSLDPRLQGAMDSTLGRAGGALSQPFNLGPLGGSGDYVSRAGDALYNQMKSRLDPRFQQQEDAMRSRMTNMGFTAGAEGWNKEFDNFGREKNDAYDSAMRSAAQLAGSEATRMQNMDVNSRRAAIDDRMRPLDEINAIMGAGRPDFNSFASAGLAEGPDVYGAARDTYSAEVAQTNARNAARNSRLGGITSMVGTAARVAPFFMSDARVKNVIGRIGATARGTSIYLYRKDGEVQMGVLAQEVPEHARRLRDDGFYEVNYEAV